MKNYKELSEMTIKEYEAYNKGLDRGLTGNQNSIAQYDHNLFMCFSQGWEHAKELLRTGCNLVAEYVEGKK